MLTTEAGKLAWRAQLDVYGVPREEEGVSGDDRTDNPWRFPGQYEDAETGLYYNRFRYYDPEMGRYLSEDPIGLWGGEALFGYVHEPLGWWDPLGLLPAPGEDLYVGPYGKSKYANQKSGLSKTHTPHHAVQDAVSPASHSKGITINLRKDLHELTETYKRSRVKATLRDQLAADVKNLRNILREAGYDSKTVRESLQELVSQNKALHGDDMKKVGCK